MSEPTDPPDAATLIDLPVDASGLVLKQSWRGTSVNWASRYYCDKCRLKLPNPHAVYQHLDAQHAR